MNIENDPRILSWDNLIERINLNHSFQQIVPGDPRCVLIYDSQATSLELQIKNLDGQQPTVEPLKIEISSLQIKSGRNAHSKTRAKKGFDFSKLSLNLKVLAERAVPPREGNGAEKLPMLASITERVTEMRHATCTIKPAARLPATPRYKNRAHAWKPEAHLFWRKKLSPKTKKPSRRGLFCR